MLRQNGSFCLMLHRNIDRKPLKTHGLKTSNMGQKSKLD